MEANRLGARQRITLLMDTNMVIALATGLIAPTHIIEALESSYSIIIPRSVLRELEKLEKTAPRPTVSRAARRTIDFLSSRRIDYAVVESRVPDNVDDDIVALALDLKAKGARVVVATSDRGLRRRLRSHGVPTLYYRETEGLLEVDWLPP